MNAPLRASDARCDIRPGVSHPPPGHVTLQQISCRGASPNTVPNCTARYLAQWNTKNAACVSSTCQNSTGLSPTQENSMPQSPHDRVAELHNLADHAHSAAANAHGKGDQLNPHHLSAREPAD